MHLLATDPTAIEVITDIATSVVGFFAGLAVVYMIRRDGRQE